MLNNIKELKTKEEVFDFLEEWLSEKIELAHREMENDEIFSMPAWSEHQATRLGMIKAYRKMLALIPDREKSK